MVDGSDKMTDINKKDNAMDFLMYGYFGTTFSFDDILYSAISKAYQDATMRAALVLKIKNQNNKEDQEEYEKAYKEYEKEREMIRFILKETLVESMKESLNKTKITSKNFDTWHKELCKELCGMFEETYINLRDKYCPDLIEYEAKNNEKYFSYGNAQKLVNMTMKNLYVITCISSLYEDDEKAKNWYNQHEWILENSNRYHIPLDGYILKEKEYKKELWSKIKEYSNYSDIQENIRGSIPNIDEENVEWIKIAKSNSTAEKKKIIYNYITKKVDGNDAKSIRLLNKLAE